MAHTGFDLGNGAAGQDIAASVGELLRRPAMLSPQSPDSVGDVVRRDRLIHFFSGPRRSNLSIALEILLRSGAFWEQIDYFGSGESLCSPSLGQRHETATARRPSVT
ncbi:hypothetical protein OG563_33125 [Nocardia vinacea]|uniref:Phosphotyrosine protein phosphatase I domain-containing protein n=1 Tax=Nocardia vinacea TaxID=96468 RepID=A0ABZ1Z7E6_9NOCA|nr:hypothetical protein [Nocardia vinacea]